jgi:hypothetical protein
MGSLVKQKKRESKYLKIKTKDNKKKIYEHQNFLENNNKKEKAIEEDGQDQAIGVDLSEETIPGGSRELNGDANEPPSIRNDLAKVHGVGDSEGDTKLGRVSSEDLKGGVGEDGVAALRNVTSNADDSRSRDSKGLGIDLDDSVKFFFLIDDREKEIMMGNWRVMKGLQTLTRRKMVRTSGMLARSRKTQVLRICGWVNPRRRAGLMEF